MLRERYNKYNGEFAIQDAIHHVLSDQAILEAVDLESNATAGMLSHHVVKHLGRAHSSHAAVCCFHWFADRPGAVVPASLFEAAVTACTINFAPQEGLKIFEQMQAQGKRASLRMYNMIIASCCNAGIMDIATEVRAAAAATEHAS